jgi:hypothetical protein
MPHKGRRRSRFCETAQRQTAPLQLEGGRPRPPCGSRRFAGTLALQGDSCCLLEGDARDLELETFGPSVGDHEADLGQGFAGVIGQVEAVSAADRIHGAQEDFDFFPIACRGEFGHVVVAGVVFGFDDETVIFAVTFQANDGLLIRGNFNGVEVVLDGGKSPIVFERHFAAENGVTGRITGDVSFGEPAHHSVVLDPPSAQSGGVGEVEEDFGRLGGQGREGDQNGEDNQKGERRTGHDGCDFGFKGAG